MLKACIQNNKKSGMALKSKILKASINQKWKITKKELKGQQNVQFTRA